MSVNRKAISIQNVTTFNKGKTIQVTVHSYHNLHRTRADEVRLVKTKISNFKQTRNLENFC